MKNQELYHKYQKKLTKLVHDYNKALDKDDLWRGRFHTLQVRSRWESFDDGSGGLIHAVIRCFDKKTRKYKDFTFIYAPYLSTLYWHYSMDILNHFIVEDINPWKNDNPREDTTDYTKIHDYKLNNNSNKHLSISLYQLVDY